LFSTALYLSQCALLQWIMAADYDLVGIPAEGIPDEKERKECR
jgi:hypothetical protein